jgi:uncharacterized membrane protein YgaE (UPF0421/DUF939 family)
MYSALWYLVLVLVMAAHLALYTMIPSAPFSVIYAGTGGLLFGLVIGIAIARLMNATIVELEAGAYGRRKHRESERRERQMRQQLTQAISKDKKAGRHERV